MVNAFSMFQCESAFVEFLQVYAMEINREYSSSQEFNSNQLSESISIDFVS